MPRALALKKAIGFAMRSRAPHAPKVLPRDRAGRPPTKNKHAFTLLELLIATFLLGFLALAVWSLAGVYGRLLEAAFNRVEQTQVVRALVEQLRADLRHAIQDPVGGLREPRPTATPVRRFGLWGTATELRLDVLQPVPSVDESIADRAQGGDMAEGSFEVGRLPELRTVYYRFQPPTPLAQSQTAEPTAADTLSSTGDQPPRVPGLIRWERDFETPEPPPGTDEQPNLPLGSATESDTPLLRQFADRVDAPTSIPLPELYSWLQRSYGAEVLYLPEVVDFELRYFDGQAWTSTWDSLSRQALPVAIEVRFRIAAGNAQTSTSKPTQDSAAGREDTASLATGDRRPGGAGELYRTVIEIPGSPRFQGPRAPVREPSAEPRLLPQTPVLPRPIPPVRPVEPTRPLPPADQWMRVTP